MDDNKRIHPMLAWWIGFALIALVVAYVAYRFACLECSVVSSPLEFLFLAVIPAVYLGLMYLTFKSQSDSEKF
jgi:hypothetical protein